MPLTNHFKRTLNVTP